MLLCFIDDEDGWFEVVMLNFNLLVFECLFYLEVFSVWFVYNGFVFCIG